jgi:deoxyribodipyrimidine photolyase-related protein
MLNLGLLTPMQVVNTITKYYEKNKAEIGIANYEGFIRQVIGWREYQRYIYVYAGEVMRKSNHFGNTRRLSESWYYATTGIKPVDDAIRMAINDGYIHHILRLMVVGNFMNLVGIHPDDVYKWFMEFSLDSYDWVMIGNVYSMTLWADGGMTMRKPYISGSGYIMKMSNYGKEKKEKQEGKEKNALSWQEKWDVIFHNFINRNSEKLSRTYYNGVVKAWERKGKAEKEKEIKISDEIIQSICG